MWVLPLSLYFYWQRRGVFRTLSGYRGETQDPFNLLSYFPKSLNSFLYVVPRTFQSFILPKETNSGFLFALANPEKLLKLQLTA